jgi:hypothetical protein
MKSMVSSLTSKLPGSKSTTSAKKGEDNASHASSSGARKPVSPSGSGSKTKAKVKGKSKSPTAAAAAVTAMHKPRHRPRVKLGPGFNQMSWMQLTQKASDLAGLKGQPPNKEYTMAQVRQHQTPNDLWMVLHGKVYNVTK